MQPCIETDLKTKKVKNFQRNYLKVNKFFTKFSYSDLKVKIFKT